MIDVHCSMCDKKYQVKNEDDIVHTAYGEICSRTCFDDLCDDILGANVKDFIKVVKEANDKPESINRN